jgi:hypothetical protein
MMVLISLEEKEETAVCLSLLYEDTKRKHPSANQGEGPHQNWTILTP